MHNSCYSGVKEGVAAPPAGTRVSFFERSLLEPNSARLMPGPEGNIITQLIPGQRSPRVFPGVERSSLAFTYCAFTYVPSPMGSY